MSMAEEFFSGLYAETNPTAPVSGSPVGEFAFPETFHEHMPADLHCSVTAMDNRGRLAARATIRHLNWPPGQTVFYRLLPVWSIARHRVTSPPPSNVMYITGGTGCECATSNQQQGSKWRP
jgi:hypothetical protein